MKQKVLAYKLLIIIPLGVLVFSISFERYESNRLKMQQSSCLDYLSTLGSIQLAYTDTNLSKNYGSWKTLTTEGYLDPDVTYDNYIPEYRIDLFNKQDHIYAGPYAISSFTIVAIPRNNRKYRLRTFAFYEGPRTMGRWHGWESELFTWIGDDKDFGKFKGCIMTGRNWIKLSTDQTTLDK